MQNLPVSAIDCAMAGTDALSTCQDHRDLQVQKVAASISKGAPGLEKKIQGQFFLLRPPSSGLTN